MHVVDSGSRSRSLACWKYHAGHTTVVEYLARLEGPANFKAGMFPFCHCTASWYLTSKTVTAGWRCLYSLHLGIFRSSTARSEYLIPFFFQSVVIRPESLQLSPNLPKRTNQSKHHYQRRKTVDSSPCLGRPGSSLKKLSISSRSGQPMSITRHISVIILYSTGHATTPNFGQRSNQTRISLCGQQSYRSDGPSSNWMSSEGASMEEKGLSTTPTLVHQSLAHCQHPGLILRILSLTDNIDSFGFMMLNSTDKLN